MKTEHRIESAKSGFTKTITMNRLSELLKGAPELSQSMLASICGMKVATLTSAIRGVRYLGTDAEAMLYTKALRALEILDAMRPLTINKGDGAALKALVENNLSAGDIREAVGKLFPSASAKAVRKANA